MIKRPVFFKSMIMMLITATVVLAVFIPIYSQVLQSSRTRIIEERNYYFQNSLQAMNNKVIVAQRIMRSLNSSYNYLRLKSFTNKDDLVYYARLTDAAPLTQNYFRLADSYKSTFVYLSHSGTVIASEFLSDTYADFFSRVMIFESMDPDRVVSELMLNKSTIAFLPLQTVNVMGTRKDYLPLVYHEIDDSSALCMLFADDEINQWFNLSLYADVDYYFSITPTGNNQEPVYSLNESVRQSQAGNSADYTVFSLKFADLNYQCDLGIPNSYFNTYVRSSQILILATIIAAFIAAALVSFLMASRSYLPIRDLVSLSPTESQKDNNEYVRIRHFIEQLSKTNEFLNSHIDGLRNEMRSNTLVRLLFESPQPESEYDIDFSLLPQLADDFRIAVISFETDSEPVMLTMQSVLSERLGDSFCLARLRQRQLAVLMPDSQESLDMLEKAVVQTAQTAGQTLAAGVSHKCTSVSDIQITLRQAQNAVSRGKTLTIYNEGQELVTDLEQFSSRHQNKLHNLLLNGDSDKAADLIQDIARISAEKSCASHVAQSFYLVRSVLEEVCLTMEITDVAVPEYACRIPVMELFGQLQASARSLCQMIQIKSHSKNKKFRQQVIDYIHQNYTSTEMSSNMIADHFQISNKYVFRLVKDHTGRTLNKYIESLRMELAMDKVRNTRLSMTEIAPLCGYYSLNNFYKAFRKHYGLPPGSFRKS